MTPDPLGLAGGDVNLYAYVGGNPINWVDPLGLAKKYCADWWVHSEKWVTVGDPGKTRMRPLHTYEVGSLLLSAIPWSGFATGPYTLMELYHTEQQKKVTMKKRTCFIEDECGEVRQIEETDYDDLGPTRTKDFVD